MGMESPVIPKGFGNRPGAFRRKLIPYAFIMPAIILLLAITLVPLFMALDLSLKEFNLLYPDRAPFVGLANYIRALSDPRVWHSIKIAGWFTLGGVSIELLFGLAMALLLNRVFWGKSVVRALLLLPMILSPVAVGLIWRIFYDADAGMVNYLLKLLGLPARAWLGLESTALAAVIATDVWQWTPFVFLVLLAGLEALPDEPYEAALSDGASKWQSFWYITLPLLRPVMAVALLIRAIDSLRSFDLIFIMTSGGPGMATETANFLTYLSGFKFYHIGYASTLSVLLTIIVTVLSMLLVRLLFRTRSEA